MHTDYPLAPEMLEIGQTMLSKYYVNIANEYGIKIGEVNKLVPNLGNENKYVVHYRNLQLYLSLGMKLTKVHKILKFKKFIDFNTDKRKNATNNFEKHFFKLIINSVFGKTMENLRKKISIRLINNAKDYVKCVSKPSLVSQETFSKTFFAIHEIKPLLILNKPIYIGFNIFDLSKYFMYEFHYTYTKSKFDANCCLLIQTA